MSSQTLVFGCREECRLSLVRLPDWDEGELPRAAT
jgi:hypothetical protein